MEWTGIAVELGREREAHAPPGLEVGYLLLAQALLRAPFIPA